MDIRKYRHTLQVKHFSDICVMSASGDILLETKSFYDEVGLRHAREQLAKLSGDQLRQIIAVMESTAHYFHPSGQAGRGCPNFSQKPDLISRLAKASPKKDDGQSTLMAAIKSDGLETAPLLLNRRRT